MNWYYDNLVQAYIADPLLIAFERVYCLAFNLFREEEWNELQRIYDSLPGARSDKEVPYWYGADETTPPYLSVSVEPSGLIVVGILKLDDWQAWDTAFRRHIEASSLPTFQI